MGLGKLPCLGLKSLYEKKLCPCESSQQSCGSPLQSWKQYDATELVSQYKGALCGV